MDDFNRAFKNVGVSMWLKKGVTNMGTVVKMGLHKSIDSFRSLMNKDINIKNWVMEKASFGRKFFHWVLGVKGVEQYSKDINLAGYFNGINRASPSTATVKTITKKVIRRNRKAHVSSPISHSHAKP